MPIRKLLYSSLYGKQNVVDNYVFLGQARLQIEIAFLTLYFYLLVER